MKLAAAVALLAVVVGAQPAAALRCRGVIQGDDRLDDDGELRLRIRCRYAPGGSLRRVRAVCRDGQPGCDADGACDGTCRFALCADAGCSDAFVVAVPLRRGGRRPGRAVIRAGGVKAVLRCVPAADACRPGGTTTTTVTPATTTSTTAPAVPCTAALSGAVSGTAPCRARLAIGGLGLPVLGIQLSGPAASGRFVALLAARRPDTYGLGSGLLLALLGLDAPQALQLQAASPAGGNATVVLREVASSPVDGAYEVHGLADVVFPAPDGTVRLQAEF